MSVKFSQTFQDAGAQKEEEAFWAKVEEQFRYRREEFLHRFEEMSRMVLAEERSLEANAAAAAPFTEVAPVQDPMVT